MHGAHNTPPNSLLLTLCLSATGTCAQQLHLIHLIHLPIQKPGWGRMTTPADPSKGLINELTSDHSVTVLVGLRWAIMDTPSPLGLLVPKNLHPERGRGFPPPPPPRTQTLFPSAQHAQCITHNASGSLYLESKDRQCQDVKVHRIEFTKLSAEALLHHR